MKTKIYVLKREPAYEGDVEVVCACTTLAQAQREMMNNFNQELADICEDEGLEKPASCEVNDSDRSIFGNVGDYNYGYSARTAFIDYTMSFSIESCDLITEEKTAYIVTAEERHKDRPTEYFCVGQFNTLESAQAAARQQFVEDMTNVCLDETEWEKTVLDDLGSFLYESDKDNYYKYSIEERTI